MTHNQIEYWKLQEQKTHNAATRTETTRTNMANEAIARDRNIETMRTNLANEAIARDRNSETNRHNVQVEAIDRYRASEDARANRAREYETNRSNLAKEAETNRSNLAREAETNRSNLASESIRDREVSYKESVLPSEIAKNYSYIGKTAGGLISDVIKALPFIGVVKASNSNKKNKDNNDKPSGGSSSKSTHTATQGSKYVTQTQRDAEEAMDVIDRVLEELDRQSKNDKRLQATLQYYKQLNDAKKEAKAKALAQELRDMEKDFKNMQKWSTRFLTLFGVPVTGPNLGAVSKILKNLGLGG